MMIQKQDLVLTTQGFMTLMVVITTVRGTSKKSSYAPHLVLMFQMLMVSLLQMHAVHVGVDNISLLDRNVIIVKQVDMLKGNSAIAALVLTQVRIER